MIALGQLNHLPRQSAPRCAGADVGRTTKLPFPRRMPELNGACRLEAALRLLGAAIVEPLGYGAGGSSRPAILLSGSSDATLLREAHAALAFVVGWIDAHEAARREGAAASRFFCPQAGWSARSGRANVVLATSSSADGGFGSALVLSAAADRCAQRPRRAPRVGSVSRLSFMDIFVAFLLFFFFFGAPCHVHAQDSGWTTEIGSFSSCTSICNVRDSSMYCVAPRIAALFGDAAAEGVTKWVTANWMSPPANGPLSCSAGYKQSTTVLVPTLNSNNKCTVRAGEVYTGNNFGPCTTSSSPSKRLCCCLTSAELASVGLSAASVPMTSTLSVAAEQLFKVRCPLTLNELLTQSGWFKAEAGESCSTACPKMDPTRVCSADSTARMGAVDSISDVHSVNDAMVAERGSTAKLCPSIVAYTETGASSASLSGFPAANDCTVTPQYVWKASNQGASTCEETPVPSSMRRLCCCLKPGEDAASMCPLTSTDCSASSSPTNAPSQAPSHAPSNAPTSSPSAQDAPPISGGTSFEPYAGLCCSGGSPSESPNEVPMNEYNGSGVGCLNGCAADANCLGFQCNGPFSICSYCGFLYNILDNTACETTSAACYVKKTPVPTAAPVVTSAPTSAPSASPGTSFHWEASTKRCLDLYTYTSSTTCTFTTLSAQCCGTSTRIKIDSTVVTISSSAFRKCDTVQTVDFSEALQLTHIESWAFTEMANLVAIDFTGATNLYSIGSYAFTKCPLVTTVSFTTAADLTTIATEAFGSMGSLASVDLSGATSLTSIISAAFKNNARLTTLALVSSLTSVGFEAFSGSGITQGSSITWNGFNCALIDVVDQGLQAFKLNCIASLMISLHGLYAWDFRNLQQRYAVDSVNGAKRANLNSGCTATGSGAVLDGTSGYVQIVNGLHLPEDVTLETYMKWTAPTLYSPLFSFSNSDGSVVDYSDNVFIKVAGEGPDPATSKAVTFQVFKGDDSKGVLTTTNSFVPNLNEWYHIVVTSNANIFTLYINGVSTQTLHVSDGLPSILRKYCFIGKSGTVDAQGHNGTLAGVVAIFNIYDGAAQASEVKAAYDALVETYTYDNTVTCANSAATSPSPCCGTADVIVVDISRTVIGDHAFRECSSVRTVDLTAAVDLTTIGSNSFRGMTSLASVLFPSANFKLNEIMESAFYDCGALVNFDFAKAALLAVIEDEAFRNCGALLSIDLSQNAVLTTIDDTAFRDCSAVTFVKLGPKVTKVPERFCEGCTELTTVDLSLINVATTIQADGFKDANKLSSLLLSSTTTNIESGAFTSTKLSYSDVQWNGLTCASVSLAGAFSFSCPAVLRHAWDFRDPTDVGGGTYTDTAGGIVATQSGGASQTSAGVTLDGVDGSIDLNLGEAPAVGGPLTIELVATWASLSFGSRLFDCAAQGSAAASETILVGDGFVLGASLNGTNGGNNYRNDLGRYQKLSFGIAGGVTPYVATHIGDNNLAVGVRYHIVITFSGSTMKAYRNGVLQTKSNAATEPSNVARAACFIGKVANPPVLGTCTTALTCSSTTCPLNCKNDGICYCTGGSGNGGGAGTVPWSSDACNAGWNNCEGAFCRYNDQCASGLVCNRNIISTAHGVCKAQAEYFSGEVSALKIYSGAMSQTEVFAAYTAYQGAFNSTPSSAPSFAPSFAPSIVPNTTSLNPTAAPSTSPTITPTTSPTHLLGQMVAYTQDVFVSEDAIADTGAVVLTTDKGAAGGEIVTVTCASANTTVARILNSAPIEINSDGPRNGRVGFEVIGVWDRLQLPARLTTVECEVSSDVPGKTLAALSIPVKVRGVAQPSVNLFCVNTSSTNASMLLEEDVCTPSLTTNGGDRIVVIGGDCEGCPQPPFGKRTQLTVNGINTPVEVFPGGHELAFTTPSIAAQKARNGEFTFGSYYKIVFTTLAGEQGEIEGSIELGPGAPAAANGELACATRGLCPPGYPATSGSIYVERCLGYPNPVTDLRWNTTVSPEVAGSFAYGTPPNCRPCPPGCRCPGGDRCHTLEGFFLDGEALPESANSQPPLCHADATIAKRRCPAYGAAAGVCATGYTGHLCSACAPDFFSAPGGFCTVCPPSSNTFLIVVIVGGIFLAIAGAAFAVVAVVQTMFGRNVWSGAMRSMRFAGWIIAALATQAQIGRTSGGEQPAILQDYYTLLKLFEINPDAARPSQCAGSTGTTALVAMCISITAAVVFVLLSPPCVARPLVDLGVKVRKVACMKKQKQSKESICGSEDGAVPTLGRSAVASAEALTKNPMAASPSSRKMGRATIMEGIEMPSWSGTNTVGSAPVASTDGGSGFGPLSEWGAQTSAPASTVSMMANPLKTNVGVAEVGLIGVEQPRSENVRDDCESAATAASVQAELVRFRIAFGKKKPSEEEPKLKKQVCGKRISSSKKKSSKTPRQQVQQHLAFVRKGMGGIVFLLHPLVANVAFKSVHCVTLATGDWVLASAPTVMCNGAEHMIVFLVALLAIGVSVIGFPVYSLVVLSRSAGWWRCGKEEGSERSVIGGEEGGEADGEHATAVVRRLARESSFFGAASGASVPHQLQAWSPGSSGVVLGERKVAHRPRGNIEAEGEHSRLESFGDNGSSGVAVPGFTPNPSATTRRRSSIIEFIGGLASATNAVAAPAGVEIDADPLEGPGPISRAVCLRSSRCVAAMERARASFAVTHSKEVHTATHYAWTSFTQSDYKPEFFFVRAVFFASITALAVANTFLNPDFMLDPDVWTPSLLFAAQMTRYTVCAVAVIIPCVFLLVLLPMKTSSRWKLPLRVACAVVSLAMLLFNLFSWWARRKSREVGGKPLDETQLSFFAYVVMILSIGLLVLMAILFVVFVVFRGAQLQRKSEEANAAAEAEDGLVLHMRRFLRQREMQRSFLGWRKLQLTIHKRAALTAGGEVTRLPEGWTQHVDENGIEFYHHEETGETSWYPPSSVTDSSHAATGTVDGGALRLPDGWEARTDATTGEVYYHHHESGEVSWTWPEELPQGWSCIIDDTTGAPYYHNAGSGETRWTRPGAADVVEHAEHEVSSSSSDSSSSSSGSRVDSSSDSNDDCGTKGTSKKKKKKKKRFVRWVFTARDDISLARALLGDSVLGDDHLPTYLSEMFATLFAFAKKARPKSSSSKKKRPNSSSSRSSIAAIIEKRSDLSTTLSTLELMHLLKRRATGTTLSGNSHAIFTLKKLLAQQADHGEIGVKEWSSGLHAAIVGDPNGAVAQWILKELQDEAAGWSAHKDLEGRPYYSHSSRPGETSWVRPQVILEMERCAQLLSGDGAATARRAAGIRGTSEMFEHL